MVLIVWVSKNPTKVVELQMMVLLLTTFLLPLSGVHRPKIGRRIPAATFPWQHGPAHTHNDQTGE